MTPNTNSPDADSPNSADDDADYPYSFCNWKNNKNNMTHNNDAPGDDSPWCYWL